MLDCSAEAFNSPQTELTSSAQHVALGIEHPQPHVALDFGCFERTDMASVDKMEIYPHIKL